MSALLHRFVRARRGSVLAIVAVFLPATLGVMALAIDLGMLRMARVEAQRAADAGALAGASEFLDQSPTVAGAEARAREFAAGNDIRGTLIDPDAEVTVQVDPAQRRVYVHVRREGIPTWFARFLGFDTGNVAADATAEASQAGGVTCLRPLAIPDYWHDADNDANNNLIWDYEETWVYDEGAGDFYVPPGSGAPNETGFGTPYRNTYSAPVVNDHGAQLIMKQPQGNPATVPPGWFYPIRIGGNTGAQDYRESFTQCRPGQQNVGQPIPPENGAMVGPTIDGILDAIALDPDSWWNEEFNRIEGSAYDDYRTNPRVLLLALFDPRDIASMGGSTPVVPTNFAYFYLEGFRRQDGTVCDTPRCADQGNYKGPVVGRFLFFAQGIGGGGQTGTLVRQLRLID